MSRAGLRRAKKQTLGGGGGCKAQQLNDPGEETGIKYTQPQKLHSVRHQVLPMDGVHRSKGYRPRDGEQVAVEATTFCRPVVFSTGGTSYGVCKIEKKKILFRENR
jgi:hypothetical protein